MSEKWTVPAKVVAVVDGDTLKLDLDLGWNIWKLGVNCRISGIDTPELSTDAGKAAKRFVQELVVPGTFVTFRSHSLDKHGRPLGDVILDSGLSLVHLILSAGYGKEYFGGKRE